MNFRKTEGFTLIEILAALVIMGIGLLGVARMQLLSVQNTQGGYLRAQASNIGYDIIDRMRANTPAVTAGNYDITPAAATPAPINCKGALANCTPANMAQFDVYWWRQNIAVLLPSGIGGIATADNGTTTKVTISLTWIDPYSAGVGAETSTVTAEVPR
ncbi:MAG: type IV pilus modification protein PilV [Gammaproteobacteria bacterium]